MTSNRTYKNDLAFQNAETSLLEPQQEATRIAFDNARRRRRFNLWSTGGPWFVNFEEARHARQARIVGNFAPIARSLGVAALCSGPELASDRTSLAGSNKTARRTA